MITDSYNYYNLESYLKKKCVQGTTYRNLIDLVDLYTTQFKVDGLETYGLTSDILFSSILFNNHLCFYYLNAIDSLILCKYIPKSTFDYYYKPTKVDLFSISGILIASDVNYSDIILVKDNTLDIIPFTMLDEYIDIMQNIENTMNVNLEWLKFPMLIECDKKSLATIKNLLKDVKYNFSPYVIANYNALDGIKQTPINLQVQPKDLFELYENYYNRALNSMGVSSNISKKERLITQEINAQNDMVNNRYYERLNNLKLALAQVKERYNIDLTITETYIQAIEIDNQLEIDKENGIDGGDNNE